MHELLQRAVKYNPLSDNSCQAWELLIRKRTIKKGDLFLSEGELPKKVAYVSEGLFSQYYCGPEGDTVIKKFFPEQCFMASMSAMLLKQPSIFTFKALEDSVIYEYNFYSFKELTYSHSDLAQLYISYLEKNWMIDKEPLEISFRHDNAKERYLKFLTDYPGLGKRIKQHEVASYLGITPTQLSRIRAEL